MSKMELVTSQQDDTVKCVPPWPLYIASWSNHKKAWFKQVTIKYALVTSGYSLTMRTFASLTERVKN